VFKQQVRYLVFVLGLFALILVPILVFAQNAQVPADAPNESLPIPGANTKTTTLTVIVKSSQSSRYLGDVQLKIGNLSAGKIPDPPPPGGFKIANVPVGQNEIVAQRKFYMTFDEKFNLQTQQNNQITISLKPQAGVPQVNQSNSYQNFTNSYLPTGLSNNSNLLGSLSSVINPYLNLSSFTGSNNNFLSNFVLQTILNSNNPVLSGYGYSPSPYSYLGSQNVSSALKNYSIKKHPDTGDYYLVNNKNTEDARILTFVDRGDRQGGLVFAPAGTTLNSSYNISSETKWLVTIYQVTNGEPVIDSGKFYPTNMSPQDYAKSIQATIITSNILVK